MKLFVTLFALVAVAACAPVVDPELQAKRLLPALEFEEIRDDFGQFSLRYVTADGTVVSERGRLVPTEEDGEYVLITEGEIRYIGEDGKLYVTKFTADLDGTHMEGDHLPVAPAPQ